MRDDLARHRPVMLVIKVFPGLPRGNRRRGCVPRRRATPTPPPHAAAPGQPLRDVQHHGQAEVHHIRALKDLALKGKRAAQPTGPSGWQHAAARSSSSAAPATRRSTPDAPAPRREQHEHWRASCHGKRHGWFGGAVGKGPEPQVPRRRPTLPHDRGGPSHLAGGERVLRAGAERGRCRADRVREVPPERAGQVIALK
jgi:hypothetical protein